MCGICGILKYDMSCSEAGSAVRNMVDEMRHRGPDAKGFWDDGSCFLGHCRLSILDVSQSGNQPMRLGNVDSPIITYNGEIYNYIELAEKAGLDSADFSSSTDTEVLLRLWQRKGIDCVDNLSGMFAFGVWNRNEKILHLVRDRFGIKPLYYSEMPEGLYFASELPPLIKALSGRLTLDYQALYEYLRWGYINWPCCIAREIRKLPPGGVLKAEQNGINSIDRYWSPASASLKTVFKGSYDDFTEEFEGRLHEAIRISTRSDVPLGCFLSSGMDSVAVATEMNRQRTSDLITFTVGNKDKAYDESDIARSVARELGTDHHEITIGEKDVLESLGATLTNLGEPHGDFSIVPTSLVSKLARSLVTVALTGDGGDELFFGYDRYLNALRLARYLSVPGMIRKPMASFADAMANKKSLRLLRHDEPIRLWADMMAVVSDDEAQKLFSQGISADLQKSLGERALREIADRRADSFENDMMLFDMETYLTGDNLFKVDYSSMQYSLETRPVLLENTIADLMISSPVNFKFKDGKRKRPLRDYLKKHLKFDVSTVPKRGFTFPLGQWFSGSLRGMIMDLDRSNLTQLGFSGCEIRKIAEEHTQGRRHHTNNLWRLVVLSNWLDRFSQHFK